MDSIFYYGVNAISIRLLIAPLKHQVKSRLCVHFYCPIYVMDNALNKAVFISVTHLNFL